MRLLLRLLAFIFLSIAVIAAVVDTSRSLSANALILSPLAASWAAFSPQSLNAVQTFMQSSLPAFVFDPVFVFLLAMPAAAVFGVLAALFYAAGAKREKPFGEIRMR